MGNICLNSQGKNSPEGQEISPRTTQSKHVPNLESSETEGSKSTKPSNEGNESAVGTKHQEKASESSSSSQQKSESIKGESKRRASDKGSGTKEEKVTEKKRTELSSS